MVLRDKLSRIWTGITTVRKSSIVASATRLCLFSVKTIPLACSSWQRVATRLDARTCHQRAKRCGSLPSVVSTSSLNHSPSDIALYRWEFLLGHYCIIPDAHQWQHEWFKRAGHNFHSPSCNECRDKKPVACAMPTAGRDGGGSTVSLNIIIAHTRMRINRSGHCQN